MLSIKYYHIILLLSTLKQHYDDTFLNMDFRTRLRDAIEYSGLLDKEVALRAGV